MDKTAIFRCFTGNPYTLMVQDVLAEEEWRQRLTTEDYRGLTPLFYSHVNPYGTLRLDMEERLSLAQEAAS